MNYIEFTQNAVEGIKNYLGIGCRVSVKPIQKNNGVVMDGLVAYSAGINVSPTLYMEDYYEMYESGMSFSEVLGLMKDTFDRNTDSCPDVSFFEDYSRVKDGLVIRLIHSKLNESLLKDVPHRMWNDLAIVFCFMMDHEQDGQASILIRNEHLKLWGIGEDVLFADACMNSPKMLPGRIRSMSDIFHEMIKTPAGDEDTEFEEFEDISPANDIYVLSNRYGMYGAAAMLYSPELDRLAKRYGCGMYILPSSVHEVIVLPKRDCDDESCLHQMIMDVNESDVLPQEKLSDSLYFYDPDKEEISIVAC